MEIDKKGAIDLSTSLIIIIIIGVIALVVWLVWWSGMFGDLTARLRDIFDTTGKAADAVPPIGG